MDDLDRELLMCHPGWQHVLQAYLALTAEPMERSEEQSGPRWADRIEQLEDFEADELSAAHGQLIALGWLKFQFEVGQAGLMYRVSSEGRMLLNRVRAAASVSAAEFISADQDEFIETDEAAA